VIFAGVARYLFAMHILNTVLPVFLIIGVGFCLRWRGFFSEEFGRGLSKLTYWIGLPALLFYQTATATYSFKSAGNVYLVVLAGMLCCVVAAFLLGKLLGLSARDLAILTHGAFRGNLVYVGLPIVMYSLTENQAASGPGGSLVVIVIALTVPVYNVLAVVVLLAGKHQFDLKAIAKMARGIAGNPLILACVLGLLYNFFFNSLNPIARRTLSSVSQMALPLALFSIGATLYQERIGGRILPAALGGLVKVGLAPLAGLAVGTALGLTAQEMRIALLLLACPAAISSHIMAEQMVGRQNLSAAIVIVSTLMSMLSFAAVLAFY